MKRITMFLFFLILIGCQQPLTLPPQPQLTVEGENVTYIQGNFSWDGNGKMTNNPFEKKKELDPVPVGPHSHVKIVFDRSPEYIQAGLYNEEFDGVSLKEVENSLIEMPEEEGEHLYFLHVQYSEQEEAEFMFRVKVEEDIE